ncbi:MAG: hypothetical protein RLZZ584_1154 [Pseudomonadota bacterium]
MTTETPETHETPATDADADAAAAPARPELPDHLSADPHSPHHVAAAFQHDIGVRHNGKDRFDVDEYCVSEGWIRVAVGKKVDRRGRPLTVKLKGTVEVFYR